MSIRSTRVLVSLFAVVLSLLVFVGASQARTTNVVQLDDGTCGRNLQIGSDRTASSSAAPSFLLWGDGGASSYQMFVDGVSIGTFSSDGWGNVCVRTTVSLSDGPHTLTGNELAPHNTYTVAPLSFSVDTVLPATPTPPVISGYSDSGVPGDHITKYRGVNFTGSSDPAVGIQLYNGPTGIAGAKADASGHWSATSSTLADGNYVVKAAAFDQAGNKSPLSVAFDLTVDGTAPTGPITSPSAGATVSGTTSVDVDAADKGGIAKVEFKVDGTTKSTATAAPWSYSWNSASLANGPHTLNAVTTDVAGNTTTSSVSVTVQNSAATVPAVPSLNTATAGTTMVALSWTAPASDGGSPLTGYKLYRATASGAETLLATLGNVTSYTDSGLSSSATYYYQLTAVNASGESSRSNELSATTTVPTTAPGAPTLTKASPGNATVSLAWSPPSSNGGSPITNYRIYRATSAGAETLLATLGDVSSYTDTGLTNGLAYYYVISAVNATGESGRSNELRAGPATVPGAPTLNSATAGNASVTLSWSKPTATGGTAITSYKVYRSTASGGQTVLVTTLASTATAYTDTAVSNGTTYYYKVAAANAKGTGPLSNEKSATPAT